MASFVQVARTTDQTVFTSCQIVTLPREYTLLLIGARFPNIQKSLLVGKVYFATQYAMEWFVYTCTVKGVFTPLLLYVQNVA